ncbi:hypothetical protein C8J57DRAFT_981504, partial [Mycena rebaudengoi]
SSRSLKTNTFLLTRLFEFVRRWLKKVGMSAAPDKIEVMHHSWRHDGGESPKFHLHDDEGKEVIIEAGPTLKWLGVLFDRRLTFDAHVRSLADRACSKVNGSRMLANTVKGLSQEHLRTLYGTCVLPILTYACPVWWTGKQRHADIIRKVQNQ